MNKTTASREGLKKSVYKELRNDILHCVFAPGTFLNELQLTEKYGVSRTPVREAISQLEMDGYVQVIPKKGVYVTDVSIYDILQIFQTRIEIEPIVLRMAKPYIEISKLLEFRQRIMSQTNDLTSASDLDLEMHLYFIDCCRNEYLISMMHKLFDDNSRALIATGQTERKLHNAMQEHLAILDSLIADDDITRTAALMKKHVETCRLAALNFFNSEEFRSRSQNIPIQPKK